MGRENQPAIAENPNPEHVSHISMLTIDCVQEIFGYLPLKDICAVSDTSKRMKTIAADYIKWNFSAATLVCSGGSELRVNDQSFNDFCEFIPNVEFIHSAKFLKQCNLDVMARKPLKRAHFHSTHYDAIDIQRLSGILSSVEIVSFFIPTMENEFYENFMRYCQNCKHLRIRSWEDCVIGIDNSWLLRQYPTLESLELKLDGLEVNELGTFFALNPNVRRLSIDEHTLQLSYTSMLDTNTQLDELVVLVQSYSRDQNIFALLNLLHERGFYRRLHLYVRGANQQTINWIASLHGLEKLYLRGYYTGLMLNALTNIKELAFIFDRDHFDVEKTAINLMHLEKLYLFFYGIDLNLVHLGRDETEEWFIPFHFTPVPWPWELNYNVRDIQ